MAVIRFYELASPKFAENPGLLVAKLAERAFEQQMGCVILAVSAEQAEQLDDVLWSYNDDAFIPHQIAGQDDDEDCPVLICPPEIAAPLRSVTINLREQMLHQLGERLLELIPQDESGKSRARERFKAYRARGENPSFEKV
jgi:DNA polymerase III subunit chi